MKLVFELSLLAQTLDICMS